MENQERQRERLESGCRGCSREVIHVVDSKGETVDQQVQLHGPLAMPLPGGESRIFLESRI